MLSLLMFYALWYGLPFIVLTALVEAEWFGTATLSLIATLGICTWLNYVSVFSFVKEHAVNLLEGIIAYVVLGVAWSFLRWFLLNLGFKFEFRKAKENFINQLGLPKGSNVPEDKMEAFRSEIRYMEFSGYRLDTKPKAAKSKSKIVGWGAFWPCSVIGYVLNDPIRRLFNALFELLKGSYQRITDSLLNDPELK